MSERNLLSLTCVHVPVKKKVRDRTKSLKKKVVVTNLEGEEGVVGVQRR